MSALFFLYFACFFLLNRQVRLEEIDKANREKCGKAHEDYDSVDFSASSLGKYTTFAIAADSKHCATVGKNIFERNGSAVDAAIAVGLCISIINCQSMGIGGGHIMNIYIKSENKSYVINARETAPRHAYTHMFVNDIEKAQLGGLATGILGELKGYEEAHRRFGSLPWNELFLPTIELCEKGFRVSKILEKSLNVSYKELIQNRAISELFIDPKTNSLYRANDRIKFEKLAQTLRQVAEHGADVVYRGNLTRIIVQEINQNGGNVTVEDFHEYRVKVEENRFAIKLDDNFRMYAPPPPSSAILIAFTLKLMKNFSLEKFRTYEDVELFYHRLAECFKHTYAKRSYLGDEDYLDLKRVLSDLLNDTFIDEILSKINDKKTFASEFYGQATRVNNFGTSHISIIGSNGDAVSLTSTINAYFGAKYSGEHTGIIYNNQMDDFSTPGAFNYFHLEPTEANLIEPGKRPMSSMSPIIIVDKQDRVKLVLGASGGSKILSSVAQVALKILWMNADLKSAIDAKRMHHQLYPEFLELEYLFPEYIEEFLDIVGHKIKCFNIGGSVIQGIQVENDAIYAYSDPRKGGETDGI